MLRTLVLLVTMAGCVAESGAGDVGSPPPDAPSPLSGDLLGMWFVRFGEVCEPFEHTIGFSIDGGDEVRWGLHESFEFDLVPVGGGARLTLIERGATERVIEQATVDVFDDGATASVVLTWGKIVGTEWCQVGPLELPAERVRP